MVHVLEKTYRRQHEASSEWRRMMVTIGHLLAKGSCKRWYPYKDLPYKNQVPVHPQLIKTEQGVQKVHVGVAERYVKEEVFSKADTVVYTLGQNNDINAFALLRFKGFLAMEIIVVCSLPGASAKPIILKYLEIARKKNRRYVHLHALRHVLDYYPRFGFKLHDIKDGNNIDGWLMMKNLKNKTNWHPSTTQRTQLPLAAIPRPLNPTRRSPKKSKYPSLAHPMDSKKNIVWAKYKNYPWWPAQIIQPTPKHSSQPHNPKDIPVVFFDKHDSIGWIQPSRIVPYKDPRSTEFRAASDSGLQKSIRDADDAYKIFF